LICLYIVTLPKNAAGAWWEKGMVILAITAVNAAAWYATGAFANVGLGIALGRTWLSGTRLRQLAGLHLATVDLRTGDVRLDEHGTTLVARTIGRRTTIEVPLRSGRLTLPRAQLIALADALSGNNSSRGREVLQGM
jgi:hypothetical protein